MNNKLILTRNINVLNNNKSSNNIDVITAFYSDERIREISLEPFSEDAAFGGGILGNIYKCRVKNVVKNIKAAFVDIGFATECYLPFEEADKELKNEQEIVVQVKRENIKTKVPYVSKNIELTGRYAVIALNYAKDNKDLRIGVSLKIEDVQKREALKNDARVRIEAMLTELKSINEKLFEIINGHVSFIIRTNAGDAKVEEVSLDIEVLFGRLIDIYLKSETVPSKTCLYKKSADYIEAVRDVDFNEVSEIVTDDKAIYEELMEYMLLNINGDKEFVKSVLRFYDSSVPLDSVYKISDAINEALGKRVWLKSGGTLVIEPTEALVSIDVNTGKAIKSNKNDKDKNVLAINMEACREIAAQLRLRNLSGMIMIDFINMNSDLDNKKVMKTLADELKKDSVKASVVDMTALGIVEVTRQKIKKPLYELLNP
jgi:ribonuclease G